MTERTTMTDATGSLTVPSATLAAGSSWALRAFGDHPRTTTDASPLTLHYVVPSRIDVTGVAAYSPPNEALPLDLVGLVPVDDDGALVDTSRSEIVLAVVAAGDTIPDFRAVERGPRLLCAHPYRRDVWVYFGGGRSLLRGAKVNDDLMHLRPVASR